MKFSPSDIWPAELFDPSGLRKTSNQLSSNLIDRQTTFLGQTMVIDKGLGRNAFVDLIETAADYVDCIKFGFGTAVLYPADLLLFKINLAKRHGIRVMPGGTLLEVAVQQDVVPAFFDTVCTLGFNGVEVSDGTIELSRKKRTELIQEAKKRGLRVVTEYGKKLSGSLIDATDLAVTTEADLAAGSELVTVEARESGVDVGIFDENGNCREDVLDTVLRFVPEPGRLMWETPLKHQQVVLLQKFGAGVHLGNISPIDALSLESMRRGLRSDTFTFAAQNQRTRDILYMI